MAAFQRFGNPPLYVDDLVEIFLSMKEKLGVGKQRIHLSLSAAAKYGTQHSPDNLASKLATNGMGCTLYSSP